MRKLGKYVWGGLILFAAVTLVAGVWLERRVSRELERTLAGELVTIRDLNVAAIREWLGAVTRTSDATSRAPSFRAHALAIFQAAEKSQTPTELAALPDQAPLAAELAPTLELWHLADYVLISRGRVVSTSHPGLLGTTVPDDTIPEKARRGETAIDLPHPPTSPTFTSSEPLMWVISPVRDDARHVAGFLALRIDTSRTFTRLLQTARFGESGETYAFDGKGTFLSSSRFEPDLVRAGMLRDGEHAALRVEVREPGAEVQVGTTLRARGKLTRAAEGATGKGTGVDVAGYPDYRGVDVVGAWTWLDDYGFAVATELDRAEAYRSSAVIRTASRAATAIMAVCALALAGASAGLRKLDRRVRRAEKLGQYTIQRKIGEGGMGVVYLARHAMLRRPTAIKVLKRVETSGDVEQRFEREVQTMASLAHPNTVAVYDYGRTAKGVFYYAMELLDGQSLEDLVEAHGKMPASRAIHVLIQALGSLAEAHDEGLVHRDVKPGNIMLCRRGGIADFVKVVDFGLVKHYAGEDAALTQANAILGTPLYMSPESIQTPEDIDHRSDLYAMGAVAYFLLSGRCVFDGPNVMAILTKHMTEGPLPIGDLVEGLPTELADLVMELLEKPRDRRPSSAREVAERLEAICDAHALRWTQEEARAWWTSHARAKSAAPTEATGLSANEMQIQLEGRSDIASGRAGA